MGGWADDRVVLEDAVGFDAGAGSDAHQPHDQLAAFDAGVADDQVGAEVRRVLDFKEFGGGDDQGVDEDILADLRSKESQIGVEPRGSVQESDRREDDQFLR